MWRWVLVCFLGIILFVIKRILIFFSEDVHSDFPTSLEGSVSADEYSTAAVNELIFNWSLVCRHDVRTNFHLCRCDRKQSAVCSYMNCVSTCNPVTRSFLTVCQVQLSVQQLSCMIYTTTQSLATSWCLTLWLQILILELFIVFSPTNRLRRSLCALTAQVSSVLSLLATVS